MGVPDNLTFNLQPSTFNERQLAADALCSAGMAPTSSEQYLLPSGSGVPAGERSEDMLAEIRNKIGLLIGDEDGHVMVEYGVLLASIAILCILVVKGIGGKTGSMFVKMKDSYPNR